VRHQPAPELDRLDAVGRLADDGQVLLALEQLAKAGVVVGGSVRFDRPIAVAVLGGTGAYAGAHGTLTITRRGERGAALAFVFV
jgi:hypothetical protein